MKWPVCQSARGDLEKWPRMQEDYRTRRKESKRCKTMNFFSIQLLITLRQDVVQANRQNVLIHLQMTLRASSPAVT